MSSSRQNPADVKRQCVYCGKVVTGLSPLCPYCREALPELKGAGVAAPSAPAGSDGRREVRRGLLYMLLAAVLHFFAGGYSGLTLPIAISPVVFQYLTPLLFLAGLGFALYGLILRMKS
jgi:hypothetical protein